MKDRDIIRLWKSGLSKYQVSEAYRRDFNQKIKVIRMDMKHRYEKYMTKYEALSYVENVILEEIKRENS